VISGERDEGDRKKRDGASSPPGGFGLLSLSLSLSRTRALARTRALRPSRFSPPLDYRLARPGDATQNKSLSREREFATCDKRRESRTTCARARARACGARYLENLHIVLANFRAHAPRDLACMLRSTTINRRLDGRSVKSTRKRSSLHEDTYTESHGV